MKECKISFVIFVAFRNYLAKQNDPEDIVSKSNKKWGGGDLGPHLPAGVRGGGRGARCRAPRPRGHGEKGGPTHPLFC